MYSTKVGASFIVLQRERAWWVIVPRGWCLVEIRQLPRGLRRRVLLTTLDGCVLLTTLGGCVLLTTLDVQPLAIAVRLPIDGCQLVLTVLHTAGVTQASPAVAHGAPPKSAIGASAGAATTVMRDQTP